MIVEETTEPTTASSAGPSQAATCACVFDYGAYDAAMCGLGPCGVIEVDYGDWHPTLDVVALDCALDVLVAGKAGVVTYDRGYSVGFFDWGMLMVDAERRGITSSGAQRDLGCFESDTNIVRVKPASYFEGCRQIANPVDRFECLTDWSETILETCYVGLGNYECGP